MVFQLYGLVLNKKLKAAGLKEKKKEETKLY